MGLNRDVVEQYFTGTASRIEGVGLDAIAREAARPAPRRPSAARAAARWISISAASTISASTAKTTSGTPPRSPQLQHAVVQNDPAAYAEYARAVNEQGRELCTLRGLFEFAPGEPRAAGRGRAGQPRSSSGSTPGPCRTARSARRPTRRWPWP